MSKALSSYPERLRAHLANYKRTVLGVHEDGTWSRNGQSYSHILPATQKDWNFISGSRELVVKYLDDRPHVQRHRDFHHLNSSQAMCINLMYPMLISADACASLSEQLELPAPIDPATGEFEYVPDAAEGTNFDFFARTISGNAVYFEFKLTESEFGRAKADRRHLEKLEMIYAKRLRGLLPESYLLPESFFAKYQLLRNLSYLSDPEATLVLVMPRGHVKLISQARSFLSILNESTRARVRLAFMGDLAQAMMRKLEVTDKARSHLQEFQDKYCFEVAL